MNKYYQFPKIDAHMHITVKDMCFINCAKENNVHVISINTDAEVFPAITEQEHVSRWLEEKMPENYSYISSFTMTNWFDIGWHNSVLEAIEGSINAGAVGVKIWKNVGMQIQKNNGDFLMIDDPVFYPIFEYLIEKKMPLLTHIGEPKNCWLPLEQMTSKRNRDYYIKNPEFHMYHHPEYPSYESLIDARDKVLKEFPGLVMIGAHIGSLEWSIDEIAARFDMFPNFVVDLSSRLNHLQLQAISNYEGVRDFFINYADRLIYGTDIVDDFSLSRNALVNKIEHAYQSDWLFLSSDKMMTSDDFDGQFRGLNLPITILKLIYYNNALNYYPLLKKKLCMI